MSSTLVVLRPEGCSEMILISRTALQNLILSMADLLVPFSHRLYISNTRFTFIISVSGFSLRTAMRLSGCVRAACPVRGSVTAPKSPRPHCLGMSTLLAATLAVWLYASSTLTGATPGGSEPDADTRTVVLPPSASAMVSPSCRRDGSSASPGRARPTAGCRVGGGEGVRVPRLAVSALSRTPAYLVLPRPDRTAGVLPVPPPSSS
mmetsp:Transcript_27365/g.59864  ORF Transcript_27365/g.59864 Transcript_27365/m.59864 type:complete len:206 (+) Transcript_27365:915-1532(+)